MWQIEKRQTGLTRYKIGKIADSFGRRMRLKADKIASRTVYLNRETFEEGRYQKKPSQNIADLKGTAVSTIPDLTPKHHNMLDQSGMNHQFLDQSGVNFDFTTFHDQSNPLSLWKADHHTDSVRNQTNLS